MVLADNRGLIVSFRISISTTAPCKKAVPLHCKYQKAFLKSEMLTNLPDENYRTDSEGENFHMTDTAKILNSDFMLRPFEFKTGAGDHADIDPTTIPQNHARTDVDVTHLSAPKTYHLQRPHPPPHKYIQLSTTIATEPTTGESHDDAAGDDTIDNEAVAAVHMDSLNEDANIPEYPTGYHSLQRASKSNCITTRERSVDIGRTLPRISYRDADRESANALYNGTRPTTKEQT